MNTKGMGSTQSRILRTLDDHGCWHRGADWFWGSKSYTERILDGLVKRGLAEVVEEQITTRVYRPKKR
jgi:hypothetical protein